MTLPTRSKPQQGIFVYQRLRAMSQLLPMRALQPQPWFPFLRGGSIDLPIHETAFPMDRRRMLYLPGVAKSLDGWWMERCVHRWLDELETDLAHTILDAHFAYPEGVACHRVALKRGLPFVVTLRGVEEEWFRQPRIRKQMVKALNAASGVIAVSESLRRSAVAAGVDPKQISVIPNGCETTTFFPGDKFAARRKLQLDTHKSLLVCVANIKPVKGHDILMDALVLLSQVADFELICIGAPEDEAYARQIKRFVNHSRLSSKVRFIGPLAGTQIADYLRAADVFVLASRREGCCNAIIEAMACGTPVVATDVGDNSEIARCFEGIQLTEPNNPEALFEVLLETIQSKGVPVSYNRSHFHPKSWHVVAGQCVDSIRTACDLHVRRSLSSSASV